VTASSPGEGRGATFTIRLPLDREARTDTSSETAASDLPPATAASNALCGRRVLVVEDYDDARELVASVIRGAGAEVTSVISTAEALRCLAQAMPDLLVADLGLPGEDGYTLLRRIRAMPTPQAQALPAVALTAYARPSDRDRALDAGFLRYVIKPVDPEQLVAVLASVLAGPAAMER
jgi:CheY-like chemotaxis protein